MIGIWISIASISILIYLSYLLRKEKLKYKKLLSQKKSSEVMTGLIAEQLAPFLKGFPLELSQSDLRWIGNPVDYMYFGEDWIAVVEIKSGKSRLSKKQRNLKELINKGRVKWITHIVDGETNNEN